jgi:hypothetical protein
MCPSLGCPQASKKDVSVVLLVFYWLIVAAGLVGWTRFYFFRTATMNQGFITYC